MAARLVTGAPFLMDPTAYPVSADAFEHAYRALAKNGPMTGSELASKSHLSEDQLDQAYRYNRHAEHGQTPWLFDRSVGLLFIPEDLDDIARGYGHRLRSLYTTAVGDAHILDGVRSLAPRDDGLRSLTRTLGWVTEALIDAAVANGSLMRR